MAHAIVSVVFGQLTSPIFKKMRQEVQLVTGVTEEIEKLTSNFQAIEGVLLDAEEKEVKGNKAVGVWLDRLKEASYDVEDILDEWKTAILKLQIEGAEDAAVPLCPCAPLLLCSKVCFLLCSPRFCFEQVGLRHDIAHKIKKMNEKLDDIARLKDSFGLSTINRSTEEPWRLKGPITTAFHDSSEVRGREEEKTKLSKLLTECQQEGEGLQIISIVGVGGIGKTTLARLAYNDDEIMSKFDRKIWVCVSDPFDEIRIAKAIIETLEGRADFVELQSHLDEIKRCFANKKFFLVLDDVWTEDKNKWEPLFCSLNNGAHGSKIVVTTRKKDVARMMKSIDVIDVGVLSEEESWSLFKQLAFRDRSSQDCEELEKYGREIVGKCKGLPLVVKTIGSLLQFKKSREEWKQILDSEMWKLEKLEEDVFRPLLLSYNDLPSEIKRCFLYCAIFPKDYDIKKDKLIKLWMAQGYLGLEQNENLELRGEDNFEYLAMRSFFQEFTNDADGNIIGCKMHDIVHDFALFLVKKDCFAVEIDSHEVLSLTHLYEKARHLMLIVKNEEASFPLNKCATQKLRSLLVRFEYCDNLSVQNELLQSNLFKQLTCLRSLEINEIAIQNIPKEVGKLIHLRYLYLEFLEIKELPDTLCDLFNLQTLSIIKCHYLINLPQGIGKLVNLRHLILKNNSNLECLPKGVERLTNLRTLSKLIVGGGNQGCGLDCLKNLNHLRGDLTLRGLGNVLDEGEAKNAQLKNKEYIVGLSLWFARPGEALESSNRDGAVLEALESPPRLKELRINSYGGIAFPNWVVSLTQLKQIEIEEAFNCEYLPALGKLPLLETLKIWGMSRLKMVGNEFLGVENRNSASSSSSSPVIAFPKLRHLEFNRMKEWEEWEYQNRKDIITMPSLSKLTIEQCPKLKALPDHLLHSTSLKQIIINVAFNCEYLPALGKLTSLETLEIQFMGRLGRLKRVGNEFLGVENSSGASSSSSSSPVIAFPKLRDLHFSALREWEEWEYENRKDIIIMPSLSSLTIQLCPKLKALPDHLLHSTSLKQIIIDEAFKCEYLPALGKLPLLETLQIRRMKRLKRVGNEFLGVENSSGASSSSSSSPVIAFPKLKHLRFDEISEWEEWEYENRKDIIIMPSLSELTIKCCPKLKALPDHLLHSTSLKQIIIYEALKCEYLPALGKLTSLETLEIQIMRRPKRVGNEFLGVENSSGASSSSSSSPVIAFPKLKRLLFNDIPGWEEWEYQNRKDIIIMPSLSSLAVRFCPKLKALPDHLLHSTSLKTLHIIGCSLLENWCKTKGIRFTRW